jgi:hypothetical protein
MQALRLIVRFVTVIVVARMQRRASTGRECKNMKLQHLAQVALISLAIGFTPSADAASTAGAIVTGIRVNADAGAYVRIEVDKDLNCGARIVNSERKRAYILAPTASGFTPPTQEDVNRIQSIATAAALSGKTVTVIVDETATAGFFATHCKLSEVILTP